MRCFFGVLAAAAVLGLAALYLMSFGVLIRSEHKTAAEAGAGSGVLVCHYFVGTEVASQEFWSSVRSICPRLYRF